MMLAAVVAGMVSCNGGQKQPKKYAVTVEPLNGMEEQPKLDTDVLIAMWDDGMEVSTPSLVKGEEGYEIVCETPADPKGVVRAVYMSNAIVTDAGLVDISNYQWDRQLDNGMVYYGETTEKAPDVMALKAVCGIVRLHLVSPEKIRKVVVSTADSNRYMTGVFEVSNYPFPVLTPTERSVRSVEVNDLSVDFTEGADLWFYVAPGCFNTFTVEMTTADGRVCTKNLKDGNEVMVERNAVCTVVLGTEGHELVFE